MRKLVGGFFYVLGISLAAMPLFIASLVMGSNLLIEIIQRMDSFWRELDGECYEPLCDGAAGVIENEIHRFEEQHGDSPSKVEVPHWMFQVLQSQLEGKNIQNRDSIAGVELVDSPVKILKCIA